jgi:hypothetical protein
MKTTPSDVAECVRLLQQRVDLQARMGRNQRERDRFAAQLRRKEIDIANLRAETVQLQAALPSIERDRRRPLRPLIKPGAWAVEQIYEGVAAYTRIRTNNRKLEGLIAEAEALRRERDQLNALISNHVGDRARLLDRMRAQGCAGTGRTNF